MKSYSEVIDRVLRQEDLLKALLPTEPLNRELWRVARAADDAALTDGRSIANAAAFALVRGGLLYALDALDEGHVIFQEAHGDLGSYWHGMMHRREGDFDNARYWFRRAGVLPVFGSIHAAAAPHSSDLAKQSNWDPYLFTGQCEQARFGAPELIPELVAVQRAEFLELFDYCWRESGVA